jgi:predicted TIM-barrel fold metal-dependent hydrolase
MSQLENRKRTRTITLEEHYASPAFLQGPGRDLKHSARLVEQLCDLGEQRIADMDVAGIDVQVLSLNAPGVEQLDATEAVAIARDANDRLAEAVRRHPSRFAGFPHCRLRIRRPLLTN